MPLNLKSMQENQSQQRPRTEIPSNVVEKMLNVSRSTACRMADEGILPARKGGSKSEKSAWLFDRDAVVKFMES